MLTLMLAVAATAAMAKAADNALGTWKYTTAKSIAAPGVSPISNLTVIREAIDGGVKVSRKGARADGSTPGNCENRLS